MRIFQKLRRDKSGAIAVETAIIMPILIVCLLGALDLGFSVYVQQSMSNATKNGIQYVQKGGRSEDNVSTIVKNSFIGDWSNATVNTRAYCGCISKSDAGSGEGEANAEPTATYIKFATQLAENNMCPTNMCDSASPISTLVDVELTYRMRGIFQSADYTTHLQTRVQ